MAAGVFVIVVLVIVGLVILFGLIAFFLLRHSQDTVPRVADRDDRSGRRIVAHDDEGRPIAAAQDGELAPHDDAGFDAALKEELKDLGR